MLVYSRVIFGDMVTNAKAFLHHFNDKRKVSAPEYSIENESEDAVALPYYYCECRIPGFENIAVGQSHSKKHAEIRASKHMCKQLREMGLIGEETAVQIKLDQPDPPSESEEIEPKQSTIENRKVSLVTVYPR